MLRVAFLGDLAANDAILARLKGREGARVLTTVPSVTEACDLVIANLEASWDIGGRAPPAAGPQKIHIRTGPSIVAVLKTLGVTVLTVANNHSFDFGPAGWLALRSVTEQAGVVYVGGGITSAQAREPRVIERKGVRVGFLAYADPECGAVFAGKGRPGANCFHLEQAVADVRGLRESCDYVIIAVHWGQERLCMPAPRIRAWAAHLARAGADAIVGHHPHMLQGYEYLPPCHVFYSLGNFLMANVFEDGQCRARYCGFSHWSAIPLFECRPREGMSLIDVIGIRNTEAGVAVASGWRFRRRWQWLCSALRAKDYEKRFMRHQDFVWRYYGPFRYGLLQDPLRVIRNLSPTKLARLIGFGHDLWREKSL